MKFELKISDVWDEDVNIIEENIGMGHAGWDCVDPKEIVLAAWSLYQEKFLEE